MHHIVAVLVDTLASTPDPVSVRARRRFLASLAAAWPPAMAALADLAQADSALREAGLEDETLTGHEAVCLCHLFYLLDDLLAMARPSGFADPGALIDPDGSCPPLLEHLAVIASLRARQGHPSCDATTVSWLREGAEREDREERSLVRRFAFARDWPWSASGEMGRLNGVHHRMVCGPLLPLERVFRAAMVKAKRDLVGGRHRAAWRGLESLLRVPMPNRMTGLVHAGIAMVCFDARAVGGNRDLAAVEAHIVEARRALVADGGPVGEDAVGLERLWAHQAAHAPQ